MIKRALGVRIVIVLAVIVFAFVGMDLYGMTSYLWDKDPYIPILVYHDIVPNDADVTSNTQFVCSQQQFEENLKTLLDNDYTPISLDELNWAKSGLIELPPKPFLITFDDGNIGQYKNAYPILKKYEVPASIFVVTDWVGQTRNNGDFFSWDQAKEMVESGFVSIYSHSSRHMNYVDVPREEFLHDIMGSLSILSVEMPKNRPMKFVYHDLVSSSYPIQLQVNQVFAYPFGGFTPEKVKALANEGVVIQMNHLGLERFSAMDLTALKRVNMPMGMTGEQLITYIEDYDDNH